MLKVKLASIIAVAAVLFVVAEASPEWLKSNPSNRARILEEPRYLCKARLVATIKFVCRNDILAIINKHKSEKKISKPEKLVDCCRDSCSFITLASYCP